MSAASEFSNSDASMNPYLVSITHTSARVVDEDGTFSVNGPVVLGISDKERIEALCE